MAKILPLIGKYYGTVVELENGSNIQVWTGLGPTGKVSQRELHDGWSPEHGYDHIESEQDLKLATIIADALTKAGY